MTDMCIKTKIGQDITASDMYGSMVLCKSMCSNSMLRS